MGANERLIEHCNAKDFQERLEQEVIKPLPDKPTVERLNEAKLQAQALYREYQRENEKLCRGSHVPHRCVITIYNEVLERLFAIEPRALPKPRRQKYIAPPPVPPRPSAEQRAAVILGEIDDTFSGFDE